MIVDAFDSSWPHSPTALPSQHTLLNRFDTGAGEIPQAEALEGFTLQARRWPGGGPDMQGHNQTQNAGGILSHALLGSPWELLALCFLT